MGVLIDTISSTKFLGMIINNELNWCEHITHMCKKVAKGTGVSKKVKNNLNKTTMIKLY